MADPEVEEAFSRSFLARLPAEVVRALRAEGERTENPPGTTIYTAGAEPHAALVDRHFDLIRHVHVNELDGRHCGTGGYDFKPLFQVLRRRGYAGWISLEAFDFTPGAERLANESLRHLESEIESLT